MLVFPKASQCDIAELILDTGSGSGEVGTHTHPVVDAGRPFCISSMSITCLPRGLYTCCSLGLDYLAYISTWVTYHSLQIFKSHLTVHCCMVQQLHRKARERRRERRKEAVLKIFLFQGNQFQWEPRGKPARGRGQGRELFHPLPPRQMLQACEHPSWKTFPNLALT